MPIFELVHPFPISRGDHSFGVWDCRCSPGGNLVEELALVVRELYVDPPALLAALQTAVADAGGGASMVPLEEAIQRFAKAAIPAPGTHTVPQLDVARNELAEVLAVLALSATRGTVVPSSRIRNKEIGQAPSRGRDLLGIDAEPLMAVVGEVKASASKNSPPGVVDAGPQSMRAQLLTAGTDMDRLSAELNWAIKHAPSEHKTLVAQAMLAHVAGELPVVAAPILVRPADRHGADDFGAFLDNPSQFAPASVRFCLLRVEGSLDDLARDVYEQART
jgi:hypothetical protein